MDDYLVIARKWRPQRFEDVVGQKHIVTTLKNAITKNRLAHAYLFSGPRGVGKTSVARIFAKALNCEHGPTVTPCQVCASCREITDGRSVDCREIDGASNRGVDEVRELREDVKFLPLSGRYKIYIIDEVHMLTREAFNALLKTLEEPPVHCLFLFATTEAQKIPPTILSRCQWFEFQRLGVAEVRTSLRFIAEAEGVTVSERTLGWVAEAADGSLRDAQSIFDQLIAYAGHTISDEEGERILGRGDRRYVKALIDAIMRRDASSLLQVIDEAYRAGIDMYHFYQLGMEHFRRLLLIKILGKQVAEIIVVDDEELAAMETQVANISRETLERYLDLLLAEEENVRRSRAPRINVEAILLRLVHLNPLIPWEEILTRLEDLERRLEDGYVPREETARQPIVEGGVDKKQSDAWPDFLQHLKGRISILSWSKVSQGKMLSFEENRLVIELPAGIAALLTEEEMAQIRGEARAYFGRDDLAWEIVATGQNQGEEKKNGRREILNHPAVQKVLDMFAGAAIKEVIVRETEKMRMRWEDNSARFQRDHEAGKKDPRTDDASATGTRNENGGSLIRWRDGHRRRQWQV